MPNWNSWTMPVTTPMAKLIRKRVPKNFVRRRYSGRPVRSQAVSNAAMIADVPIVIGTNRKW